jgi:TPR repeat protein
MLKSRIKMLKTVEELIEEYSAFQRGDAKPQKILGHMYRWGRGVPQDFAAAMNWYRKAAEQGNADAQYDLGDIYNGGYGVPQDYAAAASWYSQGSRAGRPPCSIPTRAHVRRRRLAIGSA